MTERRGEAAPGMVCWDDLASATHGALRTKWLLAIGKGKIRSEQGWNVTYHISNAWYCLQTTGNVHSAWGKGYFSLVITQKINLYLRLAIVQWPSSVQVSNSAFRHVLKLMGFVQRYLRTDFELEKNNSVRGVYFKNLPKKSCLYLWNQSHKLPKNLKITKNWRIWKGTCLTVHLFNLLKQLHVLNFHFSGTNHTSNVGVCMLWSLTVFEYLTHRRPGFRKVIS